MTTEESTEKPAQLFEGQDFYLDEQGRLVFTEAYHLKRGYCCENTCRHCPYGNGPKPLPTESHLTGLES
jgi:hypothetical protein